MALWRARKTLSARCGPMCGLFPRCTARVPVGQAAPAPINAPSTRPRGRVIDVRQVVMTLSEYERRTLDRIETGCRREDPGFADRMDMIAAQQARSRAVVMAQCAIWIGWLVMVIGGGMARGPVSIGAFAAGSGVVLIVAGSVTWLRNRSH